MVRVNEDTRKNGHRDSKQLGGSVEGVIKIEEQGGLAKEFITIGKSFDEALGRCVIRDDPQRNAIIIYKAQLELFDMWDEIHDLTNWLNAAPAVGGYNRAQSAMVATQIVLGEALGVKLGKESQKALAELQRLRATSKQEGEQTREM